MDDKDYEQAATILLEEMGISLGMTKREVRGNRLYVSFTSEEYPNLRNGEAQTLEPDGTLKTKAYQLFEQFGVAPDEIQLAPERNNDGQTTFVRSTFHHNGTQTYRSVVEASVPLNKMDKDKADRIVKQAQVANDIKHELYSITNHVCGRTAIVEPHTIAQIRGLLTEELEARDGKNIIAMLDKKIDMRADPTQPVHLDVKELGPDKGKILVDAIKAAKQKHIENHERALDEKLMAKTPGLRETPEQMREILQALGLNAFTLERGRVASEKTLILTFSEPIPLAAKDTLQALLNATATTFSTDARHTRYYIDIYPNNKEDVIPAKARSRPSPEPTLAAHFSWRAPDIEPAKPAMVKKIRIVPTKNFPRPPDDGNVRTSPDFTTEELVHLVDRLHKFNWSHRKNEMLRAMDTESTRQK